MASTAFLVEFVVAGERRPRKAGRRKTADDQPILGPAHAFATLQPTSRASRNHSFQRDRVREVHPPTSPFSARMEHKPDVSDLSERALAVRVMQEGRSREEKARRRLARAKAMMQREGMQRGTELALESARQKRWQVATELKQEIDRLHGKDFIRKLESLPQATPREVRELSELFNAQLSSHFGLVGPASISRLFKMMLVPHEAKEWGEAPTRAGNICFQDFQRVVRSELKLELPERKLLSLWKALDADGSGLVCQGEWGRFMRFGGAEADGRARDNIPPDAEDITGNPTPRRSRLTALGDNPVALGKQRERERKEVQRIGKEVRYVKETIIGIEAAASQLEEEAARLEAQLYTSRSPGANSKLPPIASPVSPRRRVLSCP